MGATLSMERRLWLKLYPVASFPEEYFEGSFLSFSGEPSYVKLQLQLTLMI